MGVLFGRNVKSVTDYQEGVIFVEQLSHLLCHIRIKGVTGESGKRKAVCAVVAVAAMNKRVSTR